MLVNNNRKVVMYTPFKNYSSSLHRWCAKDKFWWRCVGPQPHDGLIGPHTNVWSDQWADYEIWLPIRNPYDRILSMWKYSTKFSGVHPFNQYLSQQLNQPHLAPVMELYRYTRTFRVEDLPAVLVDLGCGYGLFPHDNASSESLRHELTTDQRAAIAARHAPDFDAGNYER